MTKLKIGTSGTLRLLRASFYHVTSKDPAFPTRTGSSQIWLGEDNYCLNRNKTGSKGDRTVQR